ncbi:MAG: aminodeoxychorismate synthase component I [Stagnimonas sp.]|nr:aminodeoxychorismate synthase component I [Stagnimonas sp.]
MARQAQRPGTRDLLALHERNPGRYPFLLESVAGHPQSGRYDLLFAFPDWDAAATVADGESFFQRLSAASRAAGEDGEDHGLPFAGGWFLFLAYEAAGYIEPRLRLPAAPGSLPRAIAVRCPAALIVDRERGIVHAVSEDGRHLPELLADLELPVPAAPAPRVGALVEAVEEEPAARHLAGVRRVLDYLRDGDSFQINLSRAWSAKLKSDVSIGEIYRGLRANNPAPFAGLARLGSATVLSSSPERLISIEKEGSARRVQTRPIAGTRPRSEQLGEDQALRAQLVGSLKERAEHVMLIDLERNDLGRVCEPGSVEVSELMTVESYAHVHHIVSNIRGLLRPEVGPGEAIAAVFPGGTITGCPKLRSMEIIAELEGVGRGAYTGAMGYLSRSGRLDLNILIRSLVVEGGQITLRAGGGIVADSTPEAELAETRTKAKGLLRALGITA